MAKEEVLTVEGLIDEIYPDGRFGVTLDNEHRIVAYTAGKMRRFR
ncbi:MAG: translation initiation factor, partial [Alphaproteobacteria bacterium]|nr:translation initiation factor [Alphaproteobacteria bacterium]